MSAKQKGSALVYGLVIMTAVAIILTSLLTYITSQIKYSLRIHSREQSFQIAESGISFYRWYLAHQAEGRTAQQLATFWSSGNPYGVGTPYVGVYYDPFGTAIGEYSLTVIPPAVGSTIVRVTSIGATYKYPTDTRTLTVRFRRPSWSESAVLANDFMRFGNGTEVFGKIMSNKGIRFDGLSHNIVSSAVSTFDDPDHTGASEFGVHTHKNVPPTTGVNDTFRSAEAPNSAVALRSDVFEAGRSFPVATVDFNGVIGDMSLMKSEAQAGNGEYFNTTGFGREIVLKTNGTFDICTVNTYDATTYQPSNYVGAVSGASGSYAGTNGNSCVATTCCVGVACPLIQNSKPTRGRCASQSNHTIVDNGVIFVENNVWVSGQIDTKKITIAAANLVGGTIPSLYVMHNLLYTNYTGTDIIGLIGQKNVDIPRNSDTTLRIDAALLAQQGRVGRAWYSGLTKNTITIYGAIATSLRYGFAYTDGTGYINRNLYYDNNLLYYPPPYFPTGTQYQMDLWEED
ncbi:MAG: pilus assembly PilX N-terminal domain-containing protein [Candidatus Moranbacteria bacterium]|nr:pilus assembly PilX N-terminal domain-containing protein [Candidatus Moranbacteria bacterium]MDD3964778.1 pilus assembly PilX N-terminal domain-containing protein [Candidatus Moranbacteria bacterium]